MITDFQGDREVPDAHSSWARNMPAEAFATDAWGMILVLLLAAATYVDTLGYQFVWDDSVMVVGNHRLRDLRNLPELLRADFTSQTLGAIGGHHFRPMLTLSLALDVILWGPNPAPLHLTNILLHVLVTFLVGRLALVWGGGRDVALLASLLFAIHPVHVEAVAFVAARGDLLLTVGVLGCLLAYRRWTMPGHRRVAWCLAALALQGLALLSKESAIMLPALLLVSDGLDFGHSGEPGNAETWHRALIRSLPFWASTATFVTIRVPTLLHLPGVDLQGGDLWRRVPGALEILARYVWLSLIPSSMQPFYDLPRPVSFLQPWPLLGIFSAGALVALLVWSWPRARLAAFGTAWFLITVAPVLDLVPVSSREMGLADRYLYLPSVGVSLVLAVALTTLMGSAANPVSRVRRLAGWGTVISLLILYPSLLLRYAPVWRDDLTLYTRMERDAPRSPNPPFNLGLVYLSVNDLPRATAALERAVRLNPGHRRARPILALQYVRQGRSSDGFQLFDAMASEPSMEREYYVARTMAHLFVGEWQKGLEVAEWGVRRFPGDPDLAEWLGRALEHAGRPAQAMAWYRQALTLRPDLFQVEEALGHLLVRSGKAAEAAQHFLRAAEIRPDRFQPIRALALLSEEQGNVSESLRLWRQVLELSPDGASIQEAVSHIRRLERAGTGAGVYPEVPRRSIGVES